MVKLRIKSNYLTMVNLVKLWSSEGCEIKAPYIPLNEKGFTICLWVNPQLKGGDQQCVVSQTDVSAVNTSLYYRTL